MVAMVGRKEQNIVLPLLCSWKSKWLEPSDSASMLRSLNEKTPSDTYSHINRSGQTAEAGNAGALELWRSLLTSLIFCLNTFIKVKGCFRWKLTFSKN